MEDQTRATMAATPGRRRAIVGFLAGLTGFALGGGGAIEAKKKRKKIRRRARRRCKPDHVTPIEPGADPPCDICPQRYCCACGDFCEYLSNENPDPAGFCQQVCQAGGHGVEEPLAVIPGRANFCSVDNTCVAIACPVR